MDAIRTLSLGKDYGSQAVVRDLDVVVASGSIYGFLGPNGAGKTTSLKLILGLLKPTRGRVEIFGTTVNHQSPTALEAVGAVLENAAGYDFLSARANLQYVTRLLALPNREIDRVLECVGLAAAQHKKVGTFSLGMRRRLAVARALLGSPKLLVLDEPTNGLDPMAVMDFLGLMRALKEQGVSIMLSTHSLGDVSRIADDVGLIARGRLIKQGRLGDLLGKKVIELETSDLPAVRSFLGARSMAYEITSAGVRVLEASANLEQMCAELAAELVRAGVPISGIRTSSRSLESVYAELVGGSRADAS